MGKKSAWVLAVILAITLVVSGLELTSSSRDDRGVLSIGSELIIRVGTAEAATTPDYTADGTADDVQINAAIDAVIAAGGGIVQLVGPQYNLAAPIVIDSSEVWLQGAGLGTRLYLSDGADCNMIEISGLNTQFSHVSDLYLWGNKANNASGHGIYINCPNGPPLDEADAFILLANLYISDVDDDGINVVDVDIRHVLINDVVVNAPDNDGVSLGGTDHRLVNVDVLVPGRYSFYLAADNTFMQHCGANGSGSHGFYLVAGWQYFSGCFVQYNTGDGIHAESVDTVHLVNCAVTDNGGNGIDLLNSDLWTIVGGRIATNTGWGYEITGTSTDCKVIGVSFETNTAGEVNDTTADPENEEVHSPGI